MKEALVTGSNGLIGSEAARFLCARGFNVTGVDNDMRRYFFGEEASTASMAHLLRETYSNFTHIDCDIRDEKRVEQVFKETRFDLIIHAAAQPSHDWAAKEPLTDFTINANGTLTLLENYRNHCPSAVFIFTSTNKVYGDRPNVLPLVELETRWEVIPGHRYYQGIDESMGIDQCLHSIFGTSKLAADVLVQEYGRYFHLPTGVFRCGCLTGPSHRAVELHGFLSYLLQCAYSGRTYRIFGYKGKQVRDNIHSYDLINALYHFYHDPKSGEVYNMGGSRYAHCSLLEALRKAESITGRKAVVEYVETSRKGDHVWYVSDISKFRSHYPKWEYEYDLDRTIDEIAQFQKSKT